MDLEDGGRPGPSHCASRLLVAVPFLMGWNLAAGCSGGDSEPEPPPEMCETKQSLIDPDAWELIPADTDPFPPPESPWGKGPCPPAEMAPEDLGGTPTFSIYTRRCSWATVEQPSLVAVAAGEALTLRIWRFSQTLTWVPEALNLVAVGEDAIWQETVEIPAGSGIHMGQFGAPFDMAAGAPLRWHLRNHGDNSWNFVELAVTREVPCESLADEPQ